MKQQLIAIFLIAALLLTMNGCSAAGAEQKLDAAEEKIEDSLDAVEDSVEQAVRKAVPSAPEESSADTTFTQEQAKNIALKYAGLTADQVTRLRTEYEVDEGIPQYDVEFHKGDWEYEFEINAKDGRIISYDKDHKHD